MKVKMRWKRIYLNEKKTHYCTVKLFTDLQDMRQYYHDYDKSRGMQDEGHYEVLGVHIAYQRIKKQGRKEMLHPETGMVLLTVTHCGAGIVSHEFNHAVLWAWKMSVSKKQFPIVIKNMKEEEEILHNHTSAVREFYNWFYKVAEL